MILELLDEAVANGARLERACEQIGLSVRTVERWRSAPGGGEDGRRGPRHDPPNKLSGAERARMLEIANSPEFRNASPKQIVPALADRDEYVASESSFFRVLRAEGQLKHRGRARPPRVARPREHRARGPNQVWCWDITYLRAAVRGTFYYLYLIVDIYSRKIVGWRVRPAESMDDAAELVESARRTEGVVGKGTLVLHSDNGGPMKGSTMLATLQRLGVVPSFSRPNVSDDNAYAEALFRTLKYRPEYPRRPFGSIEEAERWVAGFVDWYNGEHLHSEINYVTPQDRHAGRDHAILAHRRQVYLTARRRTPRRWSGDIRNWSPVGDVILNRRPNEAEPTHSA